MEEKCYLKNVNGKPGRSLGIRNERILCLLNRIPRLTLSKPTTIFYLDVEPLSKYSPLMLHLSPATFVLELVMKTLENCFRGISFPSELRFKDR